MRSFTWGQVLARRLARSYLAKPAPPSQLVEVVRAVCGVQAQVITAAELDLGTRVAGVTQQDVRDELWERRGLIKSYTLRGTVHLHPADELPLWTAARRAVAGLGEDGWQDLYGLKPAQVKAVLEAMRDALDGTPLMRDELADEVARRVGSWAKERLASTWADLIGLGFDAGLVCFGPSRGSKVTFVRVDQWIGGWKELDPNKSLAEVFRRYLTAYGPATPQDFARWFASRDFKPAAARQLAASLGDELEEVDVEGHRAWVISADADDWDASENDSLRLIPQYDCYIIGSRFGRDHIVPEKAKARVFSFKNGRFEGAVGLPLLLIDGIVSGIWERQQRGKRFQLRVEPFIRLTPPQRKQLEAEAARIGEFLGAEVELSIVTFD